MNLRDILESTDDKKYPVEKKLEAIVSTVAKARAAYANEDMDITVPEVNTTDGVVDLSMLNKTDKLALAIRAIDTIRTHAHEDAKNNEGVNVSKAIEAMLATSPLLANLTESPENDYGI